jgi:5-methylcytosine-specific restriction protein A
MTRKEFIESQGATCKNWYWSWSFIDEARRIVIFGELGQNGRIFSEDWQMKGGRKRQGYRQSREHIRLIEEDGYRLMTFPVKHDRETDKNVEFTPELTEKTLRREDKDWFAGD